MPPTSQPAYPLSFLSLVTRCLLLLENSIHVPGRNDKYKEQKAKQVSAQRPSPYKSFVGEPHPATYISLARAMSLRQPQLQGILENQAFPFFLTGHGGELNKMGSTVGKK